MELSIMSKVYLGDCLKYMATQPEGKYDLIITSPPYNLGNRHHTGNKVFSPYEDNMPEGEYQQWQVEFLNACYRVLKEDGSLFYNHKNRIRQGKTITPYSWILQSKLVLKQELVWFNRSQNFDKIRFYPMTERVYWLSKNTKTRFFNHINHHDLFEWRAVGTRGKFKRPFPESMVDDIISCFPTAELIFDPFLGGGTTRIVAHKHNKSFEGCEIDMGIYKIQEDRFNAHLRGNGIEQL